jgi:hypothetical protein
MDDYSIVGLKLQFISDIGPPIRFLIVSDVVKSESSEVCIVDVPAMGLARRF